MEKGVQKPQLWLYKVAVPPAYNIQRSHAVVYPANGQ
ncbi:Uncharacterised protein [Vibrio cholerae]|nr:Uncharacterised protein [Vibrio cholerae]